MRLYDLLDDSPAQDSSANNDGYCENVHHGRTQCAIFLVIVKAPDILDWNRLGSQHQGWLLFRKEEIVQILEQRLPQRLFQGRLRQKQVEFGLGAGRRFDVECWHS